MTQTYSISPQKAIKLDIFHEIESLKDLMGLSKHRFYKNHPYKPSKINISENEANQLVQQNLDTVYTKRAIIRHDKITTYIKPLVKSPFKKAHTKSLENLQQPQYNGYISSATKSKVGKILETWYNIIEERRSRKKIKFEKIGYYITFLTLTLADKQIHSDKEIKRVLLDSYIQYLQRVHGVINYFWKAEAQKNGNIHFHLFIDKFIDKKEIQNSWNNTQNKLGYLDRYFEKTQDINAPSSKIESIRDKKNGIGYLVKYSTKTAKLLKKGDVFMGEKIKKDGLYDYYEKEGGGIIVFESRKLEGRVWGMSDVLRSLEPMNIQFSYTIEKLINEGIEKGKIRVFEKDYVQVFMGKITKIIREEATQLYFKIKDYHFKLFNIIYRKREEVKDNIWAQMREWWDDINTKPIPTPILIQTDLNF
jgi:hypothetical protein